MGSGTPPLPRSPDNPLTGALAEGWKLGKTYLTGVSLKDFTATPYWGGKSR